MRRTLLTALLSLSTAAPTASAADAALGGITGLLTTPDARVVEEGRARAGVGRYDTNLRLHFRGNAYAVSMGLLPGLEVTGTAFDEPGTENDLSASAKYSYALPAGAAIAVGVQDFGGQLQHFQSKYLALTVPWGDLSATAGYGTGPEVLKGAFGGLEYRPWRFLGVVADYDTQGTNAGLRYSSDPFWGRLRASATVAYQAKDDQVVYAAHLEFPLGRAEGTIAPERESDDAAGVIPRSASDEGSPQETPRSARGDTSPARADAGHIGDALTNLGFESVRVGSRDSTLVVALENRRYNQSSADGIGLALGVIAARADPAIERIELTPLTYGVPQGTVAVPAAAYRAYLQDPAKGAELQPQLTMRPVDRVGASVQWDAPAAPLRATELVLEPVLRTFIATEYGVIDYGIAARARMTAPLGHGLLANVGVQVPVARTDDLAPGRNFGPFAPKAGPDLAVLQYLVKFSPQWTGLLSAGEAKVFRTNHDTVGLEETWQALDGEHLLRAKVLAMHSDAGTAKIGLLGYQWFDPVHDWGVGLTGGRFYAGDSGARLDFNRYFGDTIVSLFFKAASRDDQAVGLQVSLPLTPRQDMAPGAFQVKGTRRFTHSVGTTINPADGINHLRPLLLYEPQLDLDLRRDILDSGRIGESYLRDELPRMREAYELWGAAPPP